MQHLHRGSRVLGPLSIVVAVATLLVGTASAQLAPGLHVFGFTFDGDFRSYDLHVPPGYDGSTPLPLVIDFHGHGSNRAQQRLVSGFQARANIENFLVAYPDGLFNSWNGGACCGGAVANNIDDVGFTRALVEHIGQQARVDRRRVYATGISNGGFMTHRLACEAPDLIAAFAPVAAFVAFAPCQPSRPVALQMFMGLTDTVVPYATAAPAFAFWRNQAQCVGATPDETIVSDESYCDTYTNCFGDLEVGLCSITAFPLFGGHVTYINDDFVIAQVAWDFMSRYSLPTALDSYKCYKARDLRNPRFAGTNVQLADQFGVNDGAFDVGKPVMFCNPVDLNGSGIMNGTDHLTCYKVKGPVLAPDDRPTVDVQNDIALSQLRIKKPTLLCVPSTKTVLP